jgi:hypothetical protein
MAWRFKAEYLKNCNCVASCPCDTHGYPAPNDNCEGMIGFNILEGDYEGTDLTGAKVVVVVHWPGALHDGNGTGVVYIDNGTSEEQRNALLPILTGQAGGGLFEIFTQIVTTIDGPHFVDIEWEFDKEARRARCAVNGKLETVSEPLMIPATDEEQRVIVKMPNGFEYKEMEVARTAKLTASGTVNLDWKGTHSSLAIVEHSSEGLVA